MNSHHQEYQVSDYSRPLPIKRARRIHLLGLTTLLAKEAKGYTNQTQRAGRWDVDSKPLGIDNRASAFISGNIDDFVGPLQDTA